MNSGIDFGKMSNNLVFLTKSSQNCAYIYQITLLHTFVAIMLKKNMKIQRNFLKLPICKKIAKFNPKNMLRNVQFAK